MLPFDHVDAFGSIRFSLSTVVPLPVPLKPCRTRTQPLAGASPNAATISSATSSALLPRTSIFVSGSTGGFAATAPA